MKQMTTNHYGNPLVTSSQVCASPRKKLGSAFQKKASSKPLHAEADHYLMFGTVPNLVSPDQSFEERDSPLSISISSRVSWIISNEKRQSSYDSIGLPSEYPSRHRKSHSVTSTTFVDEFDDIDEVFAELWCRKRLDSSTSTIDEPLLKSESRSSLKTSSRPRPPGHRRQRTRIDSTESYKEMVASSNQRRRQRHNAFCAKDFHEKILTELYYPHF
jgi:hypothetical protein